LEFEWNNKKSPATRFATYLNSRTAEGDAIGGTIQIRFDKQAVQAETHTEQSKEKNNDHDIFS